MTQPVLVAGARTPIGKLLGSLSGLAAPALGGTAIRAALDRAGLAADQVDAVIMGNVVQAGVGPNPARLAAAAGGVPMAVPATTVNKLCLSGLTAIAQAAQQILAGQCEVVVAGGVESMSNAPHLLPGSRRGFKYGATGLTDALDQDALVCGFDGISMGAATERYQTGLGISREDQDSFAAESHARAAAAIKDGRLAEEIVPVIVRGRKDEVTVEQDEGVRPGTTAERLAGLAPAFSENGTITAGSASQLSDGACAVLVMDKVQAEQRGLPWIAEIGRYGTVAGPDPSLLHQPANAIRDALRRDGSLKLGDLDLVEINEAFADVALASTRELGLSPDRVNVNGGAIALGHPVGMSGARLVLTLALELRRRGGGIGAAALCGGGGQGDALLLRVPAA
ncbi:MAG TPA: acetyl-CoA C-acyltransferase [Streptosporangiaceae bacterium]|jgi:acetyl-CoA C-acetyltransferase|nr:acetyl-CoA C-acyltransferase [Streptosporangiaceae bacterium]